MLVLCFISIIISDENITRQQNQLLPLKGFFWPNALIDNIITLKEQQPLPSWEKDNFAGKEIFILREICPCWNSNISSEINFPLLEQQYSFFRKKYSSAETARLFLRDIPLLK